MLSEEPFESETGAETDDAGFPQEERGGWDPYAVPETDSGSEQSVGRNMSTGIPFYKRYRNSVLLIFIIIFIGMIIYGNTTGSGTVSLQISDEAVGVAGPNGTTTITMYEDIIDVSYYETFDIGDEIDAYDSSDNYEGTYENDLLGEYSIIAYRKCEAMIVITTADGYFVFNRSSASSTEKNYNSLVEAIEEWKAAS